jgi:hypothetical protein
MDELIWWLGGPIMIEHTIVYSPIIIGSGGILDPALLVPQTVTLASS